MRAVTRRFGEDGAFHETRTPPLQPSRVRGGRISPFSSSGGSPPPVSCAGRSSFCDRDELRSQALVAFRNEFGTDAATVSGGNPQKNARILIATYQTLDVDTDAAAGMFLVTPPPRTTSATS